MNQRILLFIVIFLGFLIVVGTTVVITTVIERSGKVDFFPKDNKTIQEITPEYCHDWSETNIKIISDNKIALECEFGIEIIDLTQNKTTHIIK